MLIEKAQVRNRTPSSFFSEKKNVNVFMKSYMKDEPCFKQHAQTLTFTQQADKF